MMVEMTKQDTLFPYKEFKVDHEGTRGDASGREAARLNNQKIRVQRR